MFFENVACVRCGRALAYVAEIGDLVSLDPAGGHRWTSPVAPSGRPFQLCANYTLHHVCNWAFPTGGQGSDGRLELCSACKLTRTIPNLSRDGNARRWYKLEVAKRRLVYTLEQLGLSYASKLEDPAGGLAFEFLEDPAPGTGAPSVLTGHDGGVITVNISEADDVARVRHREELHEPYRTLLGHFRHEAGHYYWAQLICGSSRIDGFRALFGDERADYQAALQRHYQNGPAAGWEERCVSAYATMHPWEDWAETWAHYLHMVDALETAAACGISLEPLRNDEPTMKKVHDPAAGEQLSFERMISRWTAITYVLNNLNRGLGTDDAYPFVVSALSVEKLRFVHETIASAGA